MAGACRSKVAAGKWGAGVTELKQKVAESSHETTKNEREVHAPPPNIRQKTSPIRHNTLASRVPVAATSLQALPETPPMPSGFPRTMPDAVQLALAELRNLAEPAALRAAAGGPSPAQPTNTHVHLPPNFSAFETVAQAVDLAAAQGLRLLGASNYYDFTVYAELATRCLAKGIYPLFGLEILTMQEDLRRSGTRVNDPGNPGKTYLCGKAITRFGEMTPRGAELLDGIRSRDGQRMAEMTAALSKACGERGFPLNMTADDVVAMIVARHGSPRETVHLQERHVAMALEERIARRTKPSERAAVLRDLFGAPPKCDPIDGVAVQGEIRSHLMKSGKPAFVPETFGALADSVQLILELGGIPSYPVVADGCKPATEFEASPEALLAGVQKLGIHAVEFIPIRNSAAALEAFVPALRAAGLLVTAGTEHNTLDLLAMEPLCADGSPVPPAVAAIFWEGACVCAAHQHLVLHGETGFVDAAGKPNSSFATADERIKSLAAIGAALIARVASH
jgi:hypothetical protein